MTDIRSCESGTCSNTFDLDENQGEIITKMNDGVPVNKYFCCKGHIER